MEDKDDKLNDVLENDNTVETTKDESFKKLYLVLNEDKRVLDISFENGQFYQSVPIEYKEEQAKQDIGINNSNYLYWQDGMLVHKPKSDIDKTKEELQEEIKRLKEQLKEETDTNRKQIILEFEKTEKMVLETLDLVLSGGL